MSEKIRSRPPRGSLEWQLEELRTPVQSQFIKQDQNVKGTFTSGDYVEWKLRAVFGPQNIAVEILSGPGLVNVSESEAYAQTSVRLRVRFADGSRTHQDAIGVWPLKATRASSGGTLEKTASERYETALKASVTDAIKAAAERLGVCFRPLGDTELLNHIRSLEYNRQHPRTPEQTGREARALYGDDADVAPRSGKKGARAAKRAPGNGRKNNGQRAQIKSKAFFEAAAALAKEHPRYAGDDGKANTYHITGSAFKCGYREITNENLADVMAELRLRAREHDELEALEAAE